MSPAGILPVPIRLVRVETPPGQGRRFLETAAVLRAEVGIPRHLVGPGDHGSEVAAGKVRLPVLKPAPGIIGLVPRLVGRLASPFAPRLAFLLVLDHGPRRRCRLFRHSLTWRLLDRPGVVD